MRPQQQITLYHTIANRNGYEANQLLMANGYAPSVTPQQLIDKLADFVIKNGDAAIKQLSHIHPDKDMIMTNQINVAAPQSMNFNGNFSTMGNFANDPQPQFNNCTGCGGKCGGKYSNADGATQLAAPLVNKEHALNFLAVIAVIGILAVITLRNK